MATTRSARRSAGKRSPTPAQQRRAELKAASDARPEASRPILIDARLLPEIIGNAVAEGLNPIARRQLELERRLSQAIDGDGCATADPSRASTVAAGEKTDGRAGRTLPKSDRPSGVVEDATNRVRQLIVRVAIARNLIRDRYERLYGPIAESGDKGEPASPAPTGDVHQLHAVIGELEATVDSLHREVDRLSTL